MKWQYGTYLWELRKDSFFYKVNCPENNNTLSTKNVTFIKEPDDNLVINEENYTP